MAEMAGTGGFRHCYRTLLGIDMIKKAIVGMPSGMEVRTEGQGEGAHHSQHSLRAEVMEREQEARRFGAREGLLLGARSTPNGREPCHCAEKVDWRSGLLARLLTADAQLAVHKSYCPLACTAAVRLARGRSLE